MVKSSKEAFSYSTLLLAGFVRNGKASASSRILYPGRNGNRFCSITILLILLVNII